MFWLYRLLTLFSDHITWAQIYELNFALRKTGHFLGYAILSWFAFRGWVETLAFRRERLLAKSGTTAAPQRRWNLPAAVLAIFVTFVVASLDESHQAGLPGRTGAIRDVILDTLGGVFAQIVLMLYWKCSKRAGLRGGSDTTCKERGSWTVAADRQAE